MFVFLSGALAALFPLVLWCSRDDALLAVWRLSLLLCAYFCSAACALSDDYAGYKVLLFFKVFIVALTAFLADVVNQAAGMVIIYFTCVVMAGVFGHAFAKQSKGAEVGAVAAAAKSLSLPNGMAAPAPTSSRDVMLFVLLAAFFPGCAGGAKWFAQCEPHGCTVAEFGPDLILFMAISFLLLLGIILELEPLDGFGRAILGITCGTLFAGGCLAVMALGRISFLLFGEVGETVAMWLVLLGLAAFFGYCIRVHDSYVKIMRSQTLTALLVKEINAARFENTKDGTELGLVYTPTFF